jgi:hypothetical protein
METMTMSEFTADSWWDIVPERTTSSNRGGATLLFHRCVRILGWTEDFCRQVLVAYKDFIECKTILHDFDATKLSPSIPVDQMWHQHIRDTRNYASDCELLVGEFLHHDPDGDVNHEARARRMETTKTLIAQRKGTEALDTVVWNFGSHVGTGTNDSCGNGTRRRRRRSPSPSDGEARSRHRTNAPVVPSDLDPLPTYNRVSRSSHEVLVLRVINQLGEVIFFKIRRNQRLARVFNRYAERLEVQRDSLRFLRNGDIMEDFQTPAMLDLEDLDTFNVMLKQTGC